MKSLSAIIFTYVVFVSALVSAAPTREEILTDFRATLQEVSQVFKTNYALVDYKAKRFDWNQDQVVNDLLIRAEASPDLSVISAQKLIQEFFNSTRDYHAQAQFSKQPYISIPLGFYSTQGRVFVSFVGASYAGSIKVGDELLTYDGDPAMKAIAKLKTPKYRNLYGTDLRDATRRLFARYVLLMDPIPASPQIAMSFKRKDGSEFQETLNWSGYPAQTPILENAVVISAQVPIINKQVTKIPENLLGNMATDPYGYTSRKSYFPRPETVKWEAADADYFYAWIGEIKSVNSAQVKRIGLIRIPTFSLGTSEDYAKAVQAFKMLIAKMNEETDMLILDVQGNRGGMLDYAEALLSFFIDQPKEAQKFQYKLFPALLEDAKTTLEELNQLKDQNEVEAYFGGNHYFGYPLDMDFVSDMKTMYQGLLDDAKVGPLAQPRYYNASRVKPYPGVKPYLKPLFVAVDAWSASCGDFFPAFIQDHKLGTVIGTRTAGAGAFTGSGVKATPNLMQLGRLVAPIALGYRTNGQTIENVGVIPDHFIAPAATDVFGAKYEQYQAKIFNLLDTLTVQNK